MKTPATSKLKKTIIVTSRTFKYRINKVTVIACVVCMSVSLVSHLKGRKMNIECFGKKVLKAIFDPRPEKNITVWGCYLIQSPLSCDISEILIG